MKHFLFYKKISYNPIAILCCLFFNPLVVLADLPLTVEDIITDKGKFKIDTSLTYSNKDHSSVTTANPVLIQTGPTSFISLPTIIGESQGNSDIFTGTVGLHYGISASTEIYGRASYLYNNNRVNNLSSISNNSDSHLANIWIGANTQFKRDDKTPALLGFAEVALYENYQYNNTAMKSWVLGLTSYRAIDPIVLSLTTAFNFNQARKNGVVNYKPGNLLLINPSVAFAANDRITLTTGLQWTNRQADINDDKSQNLRYTSTELLLGMGYGFAKGDIINFTFKSNVSGRNGADLRVNWLYTF